MTTRLESAAACLPDGASILIITEPTLMITLAYL